MDAIVLAAGYATRMYPLTENTPKPLLNVAGKPILEHIIRKLEQVGTINKIYIVTNDKFEQHFKEWLANFDSKKPIEIISDKTKSNEERLGAIGDIHFVINTKSIDSELIIIAGDNLFELSLTEVVRFFKKKKSNVIVLHDVKDKELAKQYGIVEINNELVTNFEEKPASPRSTLASAVIYLFPRKTLQVIRKYLAQGNNPDKAGSFIEWLYKRDPVYSYVSNRKWFDIGSFEQLEKANKNYKNP